MNSLMQCLCWAHAFSMIQGELFTMTEKKNPNPFYLGLGEQRTRGDVLIPYEIPVDNLRYIFNWGKIQLDTWILNEPVAEFSDSQRESMQNELQNCRELLDPGKIYYRPFRFSGILGAQTILRDSDRYVNLRPADKLGQHPFAAIRSCCDPQRCREKCFEFNSITQKAVDFYIVDPDRQHVFFKGKCSYCALSNCTTNCPHGTFATDFAVIDQVQTI